MLISSKHFIGYYLKVINLPYGTFNGVWQQEENSVTVGHFPDKYGTAATTYNYGPVAVTVNNKSNTMQYNNGLDVVTPDEKIVARYEKEFQEIQEKTYSKEYNRKRAIHNKLIAFIAAVTGYNMKGYRK